MIFDVSRDYFCPRCSRKLKYVHPPAEPRLWALDCPVANHLHKFYYYGHLDKDDVHHLTEWWFCFEQYGTPTIKVSYYLNQTCLQPGTSKTSNWIYLDGTVPPESFDFFSRQNLIKKIEKLSLLV